MKNSLLFLATFLFLTIGCSSYKNSEISEFTTRTIDVHAERAYWGEMLITNKTLGVTYKVDTPLEDGQNYSMVIQIPKYSGGIQKVNVVSYIMK